MTTIPSNWKRLRALSIEEHYLEPQQPNCSDIQHIVGMTDHDSGHYLYELPADVDWSEVARVFRVGSHNDNDPDSNVELIAQKVAAIQDRLPGRLIFADGAGFKVRFDSIVSEIDYKFLKGLYPEEDIIRDGLEGHLMDWSGEDHPLVSLKSDPLLHLWWD